jgi:hypothetical protein
MVVGPGQIDDCVPFLEGRTQLAGGTKQVERTYALVDTAPTHLRLSR